MTASTAPIDARTVAVTLRPSWFEWLRGARERTFIAASIAEVGGRRVWIDTATNRDVLDRAALVALGRP